MGLRIITDFPVNQNTAWPKLSIVVPSFNQAQYIAQALESIVSQNYPHLELIVMDGGSTDGAVEIIKQYASAITYWQSQPDGGQTEALIEGFKRSTGEIQCWMNTDDAFQPGIFKSVIQAFSDHPDSAFIYGDTELIDEAGSRITWFQALSSSPFFLLHHGTAVPSPSSFWRRSAYEAVGGLDPTKDFAMDLDLWARFVDAGFRGLHVRQIWSKMRLYPECKTFKFADRSRAEAFAVHERYCRLCHGSKFQYNWRTTFATNCRRLRQLLSGNYFNKSFLKFKSAKFRRELSRYLPRIASKQSSL